MTKKARLTPAQLRLLERVRKEGVVNLNGRGESTAKTLARLQLVDVEIIHRPRSKLVVVHYPPKKRVI